MFSTTADGASSATERMRIDSSGNVGIGTNSPKSFSGQTHVTVNHSLGGTNVSGYSLRVADTEYSSLISYPSNSEGLRIATVTALPMTFQTNNSERMRILSGGEVAIGGSGYSGQPFSVQTSTNNVGFMQSTGTTRAVMNFVDANSTNNVGFGCIGNNHVFMKDSTESMRIDSSGNVGIGTSSPQDIIDIRGGASSSFIFGTGVNSADSTLTLEFRDRYGTSGFGQGQIASFIKNVRDGSTGNYDLTFGTNTGTGTNASERMRIDSNGRVGIGGTPLGYPLEIYGANGDGLLFKETTNSVTNWFGGFNSAGTVGTLTNHPLSLVVNGTERMRVTQNGNLAIGTTIEYAKLHVTSQGNITTPALFEDTRTGTDRTTIVVFKRNGSNVGNIDTDNDEVFYVTSSDYRLKENIEYNFDATSRLKELKPCRFNFKKDPSKTIDGFIAHEVNSVVPHAISGTHNEVDADGNPVYQGIDQSKLVPLLVKTIQELEARIVALETA